jgi:hypothetical protein
MLCFQPKNWASPKAHMDVTTVRRKVGNRSLVYKVAEPKFADESPIRPMVLAMLVVAMAVKPHGVRRLVTIERKALELLTPLLEALQTRHVSQEQKLKLVVDFIREHIATSPKKLAVIAHGKDCTAEDLRLAWALHVYVHHVPEGTPLLAVLEPFYKKAMPAPHADLGLATVADDFLLFLANANHAQWVGFRFKMVHKFVRRF